MKELLLILLFVTTLEVITQPQELGKWWKQVESAHNTPAPCLRKP